MGQVYSVGAKFIWPLESKFKNVGKYDILTGRSFINVKDKSKFGRRGLYLLGPCP